MPTYPLNSINTVQLPEFQDWTDQYGMIQDNPSGNSTGNGNLFTAHYVYGIVAKKLISDQEKARIIQVFLNNFIQSGLLCRVPSFPGDREAQDDIIGVMGAEALMCPNVEDRKLTKALYEYGKISANGIDETDKSSKQSISYWAIRMLTLGRCRWVWNNISPGKFNIFSWLGRFPNLMATMQMSQRKLVNPFFWFYWAVTMLWLGFGFADKTYRDGYTLRMHSALACQGYGPVTNWICSRIGKAIQRDYGDVGGLISAYFNNPNHPLVQLLKGII